MLILKGKILEALDNYLRVRTVKRVRLHSSNYYIIILEPEYGIEAPWYVGVQYNLNISQMLTLCEEIREYLGLNKPKLIKRLSKYFNNVREVKKVL